MARETFSVVEVNPAHRFARLRPESGGPLLHAGLYPEEEAPEPQLQLRQGDRVEGQRRGQSVADWGWVSRAEPPADLVERMGELLAKLEKYELRVPATAYDLAEHHWRQSRANPLHQELLAQLPTFFDWELSHPYEDGALLERLQAAMQPYLPGFEVTPQSGRAAFRLEPGGHEVSAPEGSREAPVSTFEPLLLQVNSLLEGAGAPVRWVPTEDDWILAPPGLAELLVLHGVLGSRQG
ncbi:hypothetical protein BHS09_22625 [Myxococcus xanthus]|uniref:Uncharacterized protein n=1 Tax=Myxococcus xanthus TaxID=34 RepID=A0AAE6G208_MYXXA|nr:hypothetical protein [Myxococcus xanthus]QDE69553.1 hypothetical protein BHS09_22625 [Myxococcus xanthus]QDE76831.1 hypothetical protein BHS08_22650 [Myxococcus xanthus]QDF06083.1 hypothetical protein BHS04_23150 [Myxococcus xanthus]